MASQEELVELLIDGARFGDIEDVHKALEEKVDVNAQDEWGKTALHMAAANGHEEIVKALVDAGANLALANESGNTALHWSCLMGQEGVTRLLMQSGANPSALNMMEQTPVDEAFSRGHRHIVDLINAFSAPAKEVDEADDVPDDADEADGAADMELEGSRAIDPQQHVANGQDQQQQQEQQQEGQTDK